MRRCERWTVDYAKSAQSAASVGDNGGRSQTNKNLRRCLPIKRTRSKALDQLKLVPDLLQAKGVFTLTLANLTHRSRTNNGASLSV